MIFVFQDADQADMRRPPDENVNEQKQVDENHSDESRGGIKANEGNIPLRDTNIRLADAQHDVKDVSPTRSAINKWADILKVNFLSITQLSLFSYMYL